MKEKRNSWNGRSQIATATSIAVFFPLGQMCVYISPTGQKCISLPSKGRGVFTFKSEFTHTHPPRPTGKKGHLYSFLGQKCRSGAWRGVACFLISLSYNGQQSHCLTQNYHHHHHHHLAPSPWPLPLVHLFFEKHFRLCFKRPTMSRI